MAILIQRKSLGFGEPHFKSARVVSNPGVNQEVLLDDAVGAGKERRLTRVFISTSFPGRVEIDLNGDLIGSFLIRAGEANVAFDFIPSRPVSSGDQVRVKYEQVSDITQTSDVDVYLMAEDFEI